jgi:hypothetical protein
VPDAMALPLVGVVGVDPVDAWDRAAVPQHTRHVISHGVDPTDPHHPPTTGRGENVDAMQEETMAELEKSAVTKELKTRRRRDTPRIAWSVSEYARMVGRRPDAVRREIERKARREGDVLVAELALGVRAHKPAHAGRWSIVVPRDLVGG